MLPMAGIVHCKPQDSVGEAAAGCVWMRIPARGEGMVVPGGWLLGDEGFLVPLACHQTEPLCKERPLPLLSLTSHSLQFALGCAVPCCLSWAVWGSHPIPAWLSKCLHPGQTWARHLFIFCMHSSHPAHSRRPSPVQGGMEGCAGTGTSPCHDAPLKWALLLRRILSTSSALGRMLQWRLGATRLRPAAAAAKSFFCWER